MPTTPEFEVLKRSEAARLRPERRPRRDWRDAIAALVKREPIWFPDDKLSDGDIKYLQLALYRRGLREHLRTARTIRNGVEGRILEVVIVGPGDLV